MATTLAKATTLTAEDRCDRCGAQAYVRVTLADGGELYFCGHHMRMHESKIRPIAADVHDETGRIAESAALTES